MTVFSSAEEMYSVFTPFMQSLTTDPVVGRKFVAANTSFRVNHTDPDGVFLLDATVDPPRLYVGDEAEGKSAEVDLTMSAEDGHKFWLGQLNLPVALARRKIKVDGGVAKLMGLVPALQPAYALYRAHLESIGRAA
ncbi:SCP2 sterol-binding domain-containing protein [Nocardioides sp. NPDC101246]|uniref:SCP2 sterol-binding domain-containing protein n=1 Tax=Nocardioides sp. NPDC101246 TaxID=3364336 RepID=UPI0038102079